MIDIKKKKYLILGGSGFIGTNLAKTLDSFGADVSITYFLNKPTNLPSSIKKYHCDMTNIEKVDKEIFKGIDCLYICSAVSSGAKIMSDTPLVHFNPNVMINLNAFELSRIYKIKKVVFISSNTVYPVVNFAVKEENVNYELFEKYFIVGWMKIFSEKISEIYSTKINSDMSVLVIRPGNLYGEYDKYDWDKSKVIAATIRKFAEKHNPILVWGDGNDVKDFMYIQDFVDKLITLTEINHNKFDIINLASGSSITIKDVINSLKEISNFDPKIEYDLTKPTMIKERLIDISKLKNLIQTDNSHTLKQGLKKTYDWYINYNLNDN